MTRDMKGFFLTVEGIEGCGKTTQLKRLAKHLREAWHNCVMTKEPGGTPIGDRVRAILLDPQAEGMDSLSELFLLAASRRQNVMEIVQPTLEKGAVFGPIIGGPEGAVLYEIMMGDPRAVPADKAAHEAFCRERGIELLPNPPLEFPDWVGERMD